LRCAHVGFSATPYKAVREETSSSITTYAGARLKLYHDTDNTTFTQTHILLLLMFHVPKQPIHHRHGA
jgi:hypothetical protein